MIQKLYLLLGLQNHIEWRLSGSPYAGETSSLDDVGQPCFSSLCAERHSDFLRKGRGHTNHSGKSIGKSTDRVKVLLQMVPGNRFHQHPGAVWFQRSKDMLSGTRWISQIMQHIEEGDEIEIFRRIFFSRSYLEARVMRNTMFFRVRSSLLERVGMEIISNEVRLWKSLCHEHGRESCSASDV